MGSQNQRTLMLYKSMSDVDMTEHLLFEIQSGGNWCSLILFSFIEPGNLPDPLMQSQSHKKILSGSQHWVNETLDITW